MKKNSYSIRLSVEYKEFDNNLMKNIIKAGGEKTSQSERAEAIVKYFKLNNSGYLELIELIKKNGEKDV